MFCINMPYSLLVEPDYGEASDLVSWMTYALIIGGVAITSACFYLARTTYKQFKQ